MNAIEFGNFIMELRDAKLSRPEMSAISGYHINTIKGYEKEGRLPDIDYLALLSEVSGHAFNDLIKKRLMAGKFPNLASQCEVDSLARANNQETKSFPNFQATFETLLQPQVGHRIELMEHKGHDMIPFVMPGALLAVDTDDKAVLAGGCFVMVLMGQHVTRIVQPLKDTVLIKGGPETLSISVSTTEIDRLQVIGKVIGMMLKVGSVA